MRHRQKDPPHQLRLCIRNQKNTGDFKLKKNKPTEEKHSEAFVLPSSGAGVQGLLASILVGLSLDHQLTNNDTDLLLIMKACPSLRLVSNQLL